MAPSKKKGAPASASKQVREVELNRAEKSALNKARHRKNVVEANTLVSSVVKEAKASAKQAAKTPLAPKFAEQTNKACRPWDYAHVEWTEQLGRDLAILIATGYSMEAIAAIEGMPSVYEQLQWLADTTHPFFEVRARAKASLVPFYEEKAKEWATSPNICVLKTRKQVITKDGDIVWITERREHDNVERSKLALQGLQWTLGHLLPKKHGARPDLTSDAPNAQLEGLFAALKAGPKE